MQAQGIVFTGPATAELEHFETDAAQLGDSEILIRSEMSLVSPGTEGSFFTGMIGAAPDIYSQVAAHDGPSWIDPDKPYPARTGYANVGRVISAGRSVDPSLLDTRVFTMSRHASLVAVDTDFFWAPVPESLSPASATFARFAGVSITAVRAANAAAGQRVAVIGLGLVGNLAAQLFQLAGCDVVTFDPNPKRRAIAAACGIENIYDPQDHDPIEIARAGGSPASGVDIAVEATGLSALATQAIEMTAAYGRVVLLGSPRAPHSVDITPAFARVHWLAIEVVGGLEWRYPIKARSPRARFTIEENYRSILRWLDEERLQVDPLITHIFAPDDCQLAYAGLHDRPDEHVGVLFDWTDSPEPTIATRLRRLS